MPRKCLLSALLGFVVLPSLAQDLPLAEPAQLAFEEERWADAIELYQQNLAEFPEDRIAWLRIAMAERELGQYDDALGSLELALLNTAPEAMVHLERGRNLAALGRDDEALAALELSDHLELRARALLEEAPELDSLRESRVFRRVYESVRARVYPCEGLDEASQFDFWLGRWEVRQPDGSLLGFSEVSRDEGGCVVTEQWEGTSGSSGRSMSFYQPSRGQWRHVWIGSGGTQIDMNGTLVDDEMRLEGTIEYVEPEDLIAFRSSWSRLGDGLVRQQMEEFDLGSQVWRTWFDGIYRPLD